MGLVGDDQVEGGRIEPSLRGADVGERVVRREDDRALGRAHAKEVRDLHRIAGDRRLLGDVAQPVAILVAGDSRPASAARHSRSVCASSASDGTSTSVRRLAARSAAQSATSVFPVPHAMITRPRSWSRSPRPMASRASRWCGRGSRPPGARRCNEPVGATAAGVTATRTGSLR